VGFIFLLTFTLHKAVSILEYTIGQLAELAGSAEGHCGTTIISNSLSRTAADPLLEGCGHVAVRDKGNHP
jgi:hypothetical protein